MNLFAIAALSCGISCVILSLIAFFFGKTRLHRLLLVFNIAVAVWGLGSFFVGITNTESKAILGWQLAHLGGFFIGPVFYHMVSDFCGKRRKIFLYLGYLQAIFFAVIGFSTELVFNKTRYVYDLYYHDANPLYITSVIFYLSFVALSYYTLFKHLSDTQGYERKQTKHIIYGFLYGFLGGTSTFLPMFRIDIIYPLGNFGVTLYCIVLTYSMLRHRLLDMHVVLKKSLIYTLSVSFLTGIFIILVLATTKYLSDFVGLTPLSITVISALITASLFAPLKNSIQLIVDKIFYKSNYNHYSIVQNISHELTSTIELRRIYRIVVDTLFETLKLKRSYLLFAGKEYFEVAYLRLAKDVTYDANNGSTSFSKKRDIKNEFDKSGQGELLDRGSELVKLLEKNNILIKEELQEFIDKEKAKAIEDEFSRYDSEVAVPIFIDDKPAFLLMLGEKLSGFIFSTEDINMLKTIANQAAIALKNARLYDELEQRVEVRTEEILKINNDLHNEINERMRIEGELHNIHKKLELRVEERTADLKAANKQLQLEIIERKKTEEQLEHQAFHDQLTHLPNRTLFRTYLEQVIERTRRDKNYQLAVLFIDLDRFKIINDSLGHIRGDQLLIAVARRIETCLRPEDMISRFGGDEYAIFLGNIKDVSDATRVADRIQKELILSFNLSGYEVFITASIGIALSSSGYNREEDMIRDADAAMYRAKANGRACYEIFDSKMHDSAMKMLQLESDLRRAVKSGEFLAHYQPVVSMKDNSIVGAEALIRWHHPQRGIISPMEFIPLAEETGLISKIGEWILRTACTQNKAWQDSGFEQLLMKVNFSTRQFQHEDLLKTVKRVLQETRMPAQCLDVEITESIATEDNCIKILNELSAMGIKISIDDFGTGYSSLCYLQHLPINTIKIDKSFIRDISEEHNAKGIVKAIIAMAHSLRMKVIAEGVEKEEQWSFLQSHHCDEMQGYLFSPPISEKEFTKLLEKSRAVVIS